MNSYSLNYAPHIGSNTPEDGMFIHHAGTDPLDQIRFIHERGFHAIEDNFLKARPLAMQKAIGRELERLEMKLGTFVGSFETTKAAHTAYAPDSLTFASDRLSDREALMQMTKETVELAKRVGASHCTILSGRTIEGVPFEYQTGNVIENLRWCADIAAEGGLTLGLEPINQREWSGNFVATVPHGWLITRAVNHPNVRLIFDAYHVQIETGSVLANLESAWDQIGYIQIADAPGRNEPGTGEINYQTFLQRLQDLGYEGIVGIEHGNSMPGREGESAVLRALEAVSPTNPSRASGAGSSLPNPLIPH